MPVKFSQIKELKALGRELEDLFNKIEIAFNSNAFTDIGPLLSRKKDLFSLVTEKIDKQVKRTRTEESSPKNTTLYFGILLETKDLLTATMNLLKKYHNAHDNSVKPAKIVKSGAEEE